MAKAPELSFTPQTVSVFGQSFPEEASWAEGMYGHMLVEDASMGVVPASASRSESFDISIAPKSDEVERMIAEALPTQYEKTRLSDAMWEFAHQCARTVMMFGRSEYEIVYGISEDEARPVQFRLLSIPPGSVKTRWGKVYQEVPAAEAENLGAPQRIPLDTERLIVFELPEYVRRAVRRAGPTLEACGVHMLPLQQMIQRKGTVPYDFDKHRLWQMTAVAEATKRIGWNARGLFSDDVLEYYWLHRQILFERFVVELRNEFLATLNSALRRVGAAMDFEATIEIHGLPTLNDVEEAQKRLAAGDCTFEEIFRVFRTL